MIYTEREIRHQVSEWLRSRGWESRQTNEGATEICLAAYKRGLKDGVTIFAWWGKDSPPQKVGTCGTTLPEALAKIDRDFPDIEEIRP